jgi:hypothetical protein
MLETGCVLVRSSGTTRSNLLVRRDSLILDRILLTQARDLIERAQRGARRERSIGPATMRELDEARSALEDAFHQVTGAIGELTAELLFTSSDLPTR